MFRRQYLMKNHRKEIQNLIDKEEQKDDKNETLIDVCLHQLGGKIWYTDGTRYFTVRVNNKYVTTRTARLFL